ncbi:PRC-barrel domain-containing protein [[Eubacterium] hominis]|uniref:PRC-barrel domain-containing protein n=1 Tax=[Eubacterium] hominis TaxID=2764325 RepID=UPI003A4DDC24
MRYCEIAGKQVINIRTGGLLGVVSDMGFDPRNYQIYAIFVTPKCSCIKKMLPFLFSREEIEIDVKEIENINGDVILVRFD